MSPVLLGDMIVHYTHCFFKKRRFITLTANGTLRNFRDPADSIFEACILRFRPILMTTMAALFGGLPLAFGTGTGQNFGSR